VHVQSPLSETPNPSNTIYVANHAVRLCVTTIGDHTKPALILLHGFPDNSLGMMAVAQELARDYFVLVPDGRGINLSDAPSRIIGIHDRSIGIRCNRHC
jgi:pimeloyl-ACP methyl ester carboxylesterase